ncbi:hypothetical protein NQ317_007948 [Molorchus minor]|uniref:Uncharacterized protein n=1 Tax=Molorchus minor TaxID=1323400 RepID=A0ABQ9IQH2_9CUCU|nr:hypothetical protein NQ317_007948 [Molorchus minor]
MVCKATAPLTTPDSSCDTGKRIDYDYSQSDSSTPDLARTILKARTIVFDVFPYIFRLKESIATIPKMIRAFPTFPEFSRFGPTLSRRLETPCLVQESIATIPEMIKHSNYSRIFPEFCSSPPEGWCLVSFPYIEDFGCEESITTIPEAIRALPILPELSRSIGPSCLVSLPNIFRFKESIAAIPEMIEHSRIFPILSELLPKARNTVFDVRGIDCDYSPKRSEPSRSCPNSPEAENYRVWCLYLDFQREDAGPQATPLASEAATAALAAQPPRQPRKARKLISARRAERLEQSFIVNNIKDGGQKRAILLRSLNEEYYILLRNLCTPRLPETKTYEDLVTILTDFFSPVKSLFAERLKFYTAQQEANESVSDWLARVKSLEQTAILVTNYKCRSRQRQPPAAAAVCQIIRYPEHQVRQVDIGERGVRNSDSQVPCLWLPQS